jgi:hypothetical protein
VIENGINVLKDNVLDVSGLADNNFAGTNLFYNTIYTLIVGTRNQLPNAGDTQFQNLTINFRFPLETTNLIIPECARLIPNLQTLTYDSTIIFSNGVLDLSNLQIQSIGNSAFYRMKLRKIVFPSSCTVFGSKVFQSSSPGSPLEEVIIPTKLFTNVPDNFFESCNSLNSLIVG